MGGKFRKSAVFGLILYISVILCVSVLAAQEPVFRLDTDNLNLQKGVSCSLVVSMKNAQGAKITVIDGLENFDVLSQNSSTSVSIAGNESSYQEDQYYTVMPKTTGQFTLKGIVEYNGTTYETNELQVTVAEGSQNTGEAESDLFVTTKVSKSDAYLGEKIIVTYELYTRYNIENFGFTDYTSIDGVIAKDTPSDQLSAEYVYLGGVRYAKYEAKQLILDPIKAGTHTIPSFNMQVNVITNDGSGGIFGGGFGGFLNRSQPMYLQTEEKELTVKSLPIDGRPKDFSGIVGKPQLDSRYSREQLNYGESLSLSVTVSGDCNLDGLKNIFSGQLLGFSVYETQKNTTESVVNGEYYVQKEFEAILVPEKNGIIDISPVSISYFNPDSEKYERAEISGASIEVLGDMPSQVNNGGNVQIGVSETIRISQVNYDEPDSGYFTIRMTKQMIFAILIGFAILLTLTAIILFLVLKRKKQDTTLKSLYRQLMATKDVNKIYSLFGAMVKHCFNLSLKADSQAVIRNGIPDIELAERVTDIMEYMESAEVHKGNGHMKLIEKIRNVYPMISQSRKTESKIHQDAFKRKWHPFSRRA